MKKKSKYGINSGNTIRLGTLCRKYRSYACLKHIIVKTVQNAILIGEDATNKNRRLMNELATFVDDGGLEHCQVRLQRNRWSNVPRDVEYTMNKRKRWLLPYLIEKAIDAVRKARMADESISSVARADVCRSGRDTRDVNIFHLSMVRRVLLPFNRDSTSFPNNCTGVDDSRLALPHVTASNAKSYESDLQAKGADRGDEIYHRSTRAKRARIRRGLPPVDNVEQDSDRHDPHRPIPVHEPLASPDDDVPLIRYEVCSPDKLLAHKSHSDGRSGYLNLYDTYRCKQGNYHYNNTKSRRKCKGIFNLYHRDIRQCVVEGTDNYRHSEVDSVEIHSTVHGSPKPRESHYMYDLSVAVNKAMLISQNGSDKIRKCRKYACKSSSQYNQNHPNMTLGGECVAKHPKGSFIYVDNPNTEDDLHVDSSDHSSLLSSDWSVLGQVVTPIMRSKVEPSPVTLLCEEITIERLRADFGATYVEGSCVPRCFTVDICAQILKNLQTEKNDKIYCAKAGLMLIVEEIQSRAYCSNTKHCRFHIESDLDMSMLTEVQQWLESIVAMETTTCSPHRLITMVTKVIDWIQNGSSICDKLIVVSYQKTVVPPGIIWQKQPYLFSSHTVEEVHCMLDTGSTKTNSTLSHLLLRSRSVVDYCDICYYPLTTTDDNDVSANFNGVAMATCNHWFCRECWQSHLVARIQIGDVNIQCPGHGCDVHVDNTTVVSLLPYDYYRRHLSHVTTAMLERCSQWKWCPNARCGRAGKITNHHDSVLVESGVTRGISVACRCGHTWCFTCSGEPHLLSLCEQTGAYIKMVQQEERGMQPDLLFFVDVKRCPYCDYPMEKSGGCQHMACSLCRGQFCWECLCPWADHGASIVCPGGRVAAQSFQIDVIDFHHLNRIYILDAMFYRKRRKQTSRVAALARMRYLVFKTRFRAARRLARLNDVGRFWAMFSQAVELKHIVQTCDFMFEGLYLLEQAYVVLSNCGKRQHLPAMMVHLQRLRFIIDQLHELFTSSTPDLIELETKLESLCRHGTKCAKGLIIFTGMVQRKIKSSRKTQSNTGLLTNVL